LKGKQPLEEVLSLTILALIALALPIAPLYMIYERFVGGESFCLILVEGILFLKTHKNPLMEAKK
jgi:hypothetical protein